MSAPSQEDVLFGKIAIKNRIASEAQVRECIGLLEANGGGVDLGKILLKKGYISAPQYQAITNHLRAILEKNGKDAPAAAPAAGGAPAAAEKPRENGKKGTVFTPTDVAKMSFKHLVGRPLADYLGEARRLGASDFHFQVDTAPFIRLHGHLVYFDHPKLDGEYTEPRIREIFGEYEKDVFDKHNDVDFAFEVGHGRYRANALRQRKGVDAVFRIIPDHIPTLEELHLPEVLRKFTTYRQGIVLVTGPAGCGKSSTMAALVDIINEEQHDHIVVCEDPIEYIFTSKNCNVNQRHVRVHTQNFATALRSAMRSDPDYIVVGEMRDLETISMAITAAETGHLVFGTLHTTNAIRSVDRIIDVYPPKEQEQIRSMVSESMRGVICQQLIPRADATGREPALEVMFATPAVANIIREKKTFQLTSVLQTGAKQGMVTMDDSIADLLRRKLITKEEAIYRAESPERFR
jgi:twitching motility protein PilT